MEIKQLLLEKCTSIVNNRLKNIQETISSNQKALESESKSSAGDKHETGRAMLQLEMEKASQQLAGISDMNAILSKIDITKTSKNSCLGSLVYTNHGNFYLSISVGQIVIDSALFFAVSLSSPIGKLLLGKEEKDDFLFNGKKYNIILIR